MSNSIGGAGPQSGAGGAAASGGQARQLPKVDEFQKSVQSMVDKQDQNKVKDQKSIFGFSGSA